MGCRVPYVCCLSYRQLKSLLVMHAGDLGGFTCCGHNMTSHNTRAPPLQRLIKPCDASDNPDKLCCAVPSTTGSWCEAS